MIQAYWGLTHPSVSSVKQENKFLSQMAKKKNIVLCMNSVMYPGGQTQGHGSTRPPTAFPNANVSPVCLVVPADDPGGDKPSKSKPKNFP